MRTLPIYVEWLFYYNADVPVKLMCGYCRIIGIFVAGKQAV